ncbi:MAG: response regulator [Mariprofundaceae bacterium]|nr:response regulator [Mariprofundaceae bacterium]
MDYSQFSMHDLFRLEAETQLAVLSEALLQASSGKQPDDATLEAMMRAAHSLKGAARIIQLDEAVQIAHQLEDVFVAMQEARLQWQMHFLSPLLSAIDVLQRWADQQVVEPLQQHEVLQQLTAIVENNLLASQAHGLTQTIETLPPAIEPAAKEATAVVDSAPETERSTAHPTTSHVRISSQQIGRMLGLAGEIQTEWQWLKPLAANLQHIKRGNREALNLLQTLEDTIIQSSAAVSETCMPALQHAQGLLQHAQQQLGDGMARLEQYDRTVFHLSQRLHQLTVASRMQPFSEGTQGLKRMVFDLGVQLGKQVTLNIEGADTLVDREILDKIQPPLQQLLRNAVDHGIDDPVAREVAGKPAVSQIRLRAMHQSGMLKIMVADDGAGIDLEQLRQRIVQRGHAAPDMVERMHETELLSFLFLPGFSMRDQVSEISGRGVGLDVVDMAVRDVQGVIHVVTDLAKGTRFELHLPVSLAVTRALHVLIGGQSYAIPLARLQGTLQIEEASLKHSDGRPYVYHQEHYVGLVEATDVLNCNGDYDHAGVYPVLLLGTTQQTVGLIVDALVGIKDLVEKPLPEALGKVQDITSCAVLPDGQLLYMLDTQDIVRSMERCIAAQPSSHSNAAQQADGSVASLRVLVVDDSITVRETERKLLQAAGYAVDVAVDGMDGWNMLCANTYDLLLTDVDMPHLDGIALVERLRDDTRFMTLPVMVVSYKENEKDRMRGLEAGADAYLGKSSFDNNSLLLRVHELIGEGV